MRWSGRRIIAFSLTILLIVSVMLLALVIGRTARAFLEVNSVRRVAAGEQPGVRPWMTIPYIAHTYKVPEDQLWSAIGVTPASRDRRAPLWALAKRQGHDLNADIATLNATIDLLGGEYPQVLPPTPNGPPRRGTPAATP